MWKNRQILLDFLMPELVTNWTKLNAFSLILSAMFTQQQSPIDQMFIDWLNICRWQSKTYKENSPGTYGLKREK